MASLEHEEGLDKRHDELLDYVCSLCVKKGKKTEAEFYCGKCKQYYCLICEGWHQSFQVDHEVAGKMEKSSWGKPVIDEEIVEKCSKHRGKEIELFCVDHQSLCCSVCISMNHRTCENVQYIPEAAKDFSTGEELPRAIADAKTTMTKLLEVKDAREKSMTKLMKSKSDFQTCSKDVGERALEKLKMLQENAEVEMEKLFTKLDRDLQTDIQTCEEYLTDLQKMSQDPNTATFSDIQRFIRTKRMLTRSTEGTKQLEKMTTRVLKDHFRFKADSKLEGAIETIEALGKFEAFVPGIQEGETGLDETLLSQSSNRKILAKQTQNVPDIIQTRNVNIFIDEFNANNSVGFVQLQNGKLYLLCINSCDVGRGYKSTSKYLFQVELVDKAIKAINSHVLNMRFNNDFDCVGCCVGRNYVALKIERNVIVHKLTENFNGECTRISEGCSWIRFRAKKLFMCCSKKVIIYNGFEFWEDDIIAFDQTVLKSVSLERFFSVESVEVNGDGSLLYIAGKYTGLITMDTTGKVMSCLSEDCLLGVSGMCVGRDGKLFVLNSRTCQVVQVDKHGTVVERVVTDGAHGLEKPKGIFYYTGEDHDSLFVTKSDDHRTIQVIDL